MHLRFPFPYDSQFRASVTLFEWRRLLTLGCTLTIGSSDGLRSTATWNLSVPFLFSLFLTIPIPFTTTRYVDRETGEPIPRPTTPAGWEAAHWYQPLCGETWPRQWGGYVNWESACIDSLSVRLMWGEVRDSWTKGDPRRSLFFYPMDILGRYEMTREVIFADDMPVHISPEKVVPGTVEVSVDTWKRHRFPWWPVTYSITRATVKTDPTGIMVPGKGENSWDCDAYDLRIDITLPLRTYRSPVEARRLPALAAWEASELAAADAREQIEEEPMSTHTVVIYHKDCPDGAASALVAKQAFTRPCAAIFEPVDQNVEFIPMAYGERPEWERLAGCVVWFVDFSWPRDAILALATVAAAVYVADHHKTAKEALDGIPTTGDGRCPIHIKFDLAKCGCVLTHEMTMPAREIDPFFLYIQDRDLWKWELPSSREVAAAVSTYGRTLEGMEKAYGEWTIRGRGHFVEIGERVLALQRQMVENLGRTAQVRDFHGHQVPVVNVPQETGLQSEVGEWLCQQHDYAPFAVCYGDTGAQRRYSLRAKMRDGVLFDCGAFVRQFGGGGHPGAAGFSSP